MNGFKRFGAAAVIVLVILHGDMIGLSHLKPFKQLVQRGLIAVVLLPHFTGAKHLHDHREVLLVLRRFVVQIEDQRKQQHGGRRIPKRILCLTSLWRGGFEQIGHKPLHIVIVP